MIILTIRYTTSVSGSAIIRPLQGHDLPAELLNVLEVKGVPD
jgi:hypothetical protein